MVSEENMRVMVEDTRFTECIAISRQRQGKEL
jgi:hypothetical protein